MGGFSNSTVGGIGNLIRSWIQSVPFVSGSTGWRISKNGNAEFNGATFRGSIVITQSQDLLMYSTAAPTLNKLILAIAGSAGVDSTGNAFSQGLSIWDSSGVLIGQWGTGGFQLINDANTGQIQIQANNGANRSPRIYFQPNTGFSSTNGYIEANGTALPSPFDATLLVGPVGTAGHDANLSFVLMQLMTGTSLNGAKGLFGWNNNATSAVVAQWDGAGFHLTPGSIMSAEPGTANPPTQVGWHNLILNAGYGNATGLVAARYQYEGMNGGRGRLNGAIQLTANKAGGSIIGTLPAGFHPINQQSFNCPNNLSGQSGLATSVHIDTSGNVVHEPAGVTGNVVIFDDLCFVLD